MFINKIKKGALLIIIALFLIKTVSAQYYGGDWLGFLGYTDLSSLYASNFEWFDFFLYFIIFGSLIRLVFEKRFGEGIALKGLTFGLGAALSLSLVWWESYQGESLIMMGGGPLLTAILIAAAIGLFLFLRRKYGFFKALLISAVILILLATLLRGRLPDFLSEFLEKIVGIAFLAIIVAILLFFFGKHKGKNQTTIIQQQPRIKEKKEKGKKQKEEQEKKKEKEEQQETITQTIERAIRITLNYCNRVSSSRQNLENYLNSGKRDDLIDLLHQTYDLMRSYNPTRGSAVRLAQQAGAIKQMYGSFDKTKNNPNQRNVVVTGIMGRIRENRINIMQILNDALSKLPR